MSRTLTTILIGSALLATALPANAENIVGDTALLRTLDKVTATTKDYRVKVGETLKYGSLEITVKHCEKKPPEETPETYVFVQIGDNRLDGGGDQTELETLFSGWMFGSNPALSALEHPVYDVWPIACEPANGLRGR